MSAAPVLIPTSNVPASSANGARLTTQTIDLSGLRDIHTLSEPPFFPPAIGWWIATGVVIILFLFVGSWYRFYYQSSKQYALRLLNQIARSQFPTVTIGKEVGKLLKRVALVCFPRSDVAGLSGDAWAHFLYEHGGHTLSQMQANFIAESAYMPIEKTVAIDEKKLYTATKQWIKFVYKKGRHGNKRTRYFGYNSKR